MRIRSNLVVVVFGLVAACSSPIEVREAASGTGALVLPAAAESAGEAIDEATLLRVVEVLAADELAGRGPSTEGDRAARRYISDVLAEAGCVPGAEDGSWEQSIGLVGITSRMPESLPFSRGDDVLNIAWWDEYIAVGGVQQEEVSIEQREVVFAGYGITAVLLMLNNDPDWEGDLFAGEKRLYYGRWTYKYESAARQGAVGAILIHTPPSAGYPWQVVQNSWTGEQFELPAGDEDRLQVAGWVTDAAAGRLVEFAGLDLGELIDAARSRDFRPVPLGVTMSLSFTNELDRGSESANVLGLLPGRDPELRDEIVVYTAHHDHLGRGAPDADGDAIYNGARDNAAGVALVLGVAKAFAALPEPPRRSILFLLVAAEEQGLLGSRFFANNPTVDPGRIAANINADSPNVFGRTRDVAVIGRGKSSLEGLLEAAAALQGRVVVDEPFPDKGYYYRSDQFNFAKIGVPALYFKSGTDFLDRPPGWGKEIEDRWRAGRYHQPSDEIYEEWDLAGLVEDARLAFYVGLAAAEADAPPTWNPGDEFESVRAP